MRTTHFWRSLALCLALVPWPAQSQGDAEDAYVEANILSIFYHELGHALVDVMQLPVFGQEEDAADTASILLIDAFFEEDSATAIARDAAFGFLDEADAAGDDPAWWDVHGPDLQRYYNLVCLFYGANPEARDDLAEDLDLPEERAESCEEEFELAYDSWGPVFEELADAGPGNSLTFESTEDTLLSRVIEEEVSALNSELSLPTALDVIVEPCDEANAFYDLESREIIICTELDAHLREIRFKE